VFDVPGAHSRVGPWGSGPVSYRATLLRRWSRRDVLAVLVVAASVAFLTGAGLVATAATGELEGVAAEFETPASAQVYDDPAAARAAAGPGDLRLPLARATADDRQVTVVGVPPGAGSFAPNSRLSLPARPPPGVVAGPVEEQTSVTLRGAGGSAEVTVRPRTERSALPERWYVARSGAVADLGATGALVLTPGDGPTPVVGVLAFFLAGSRQVVRSLWLATAGAGLLLGVTVFAATRMTVRDRTATIRVARATGARPRDLLALFGARGALQTAVGVAGGYAVGVVAPNAAVNAAVFVGRSTSLSLRVTPRLAGLLAPAYLLLVGVGALGGMVAVLPAVRRPPATLERHAAGPPTRPWLPSLARTTLLDWRAVVPTAASLSVFVVVVVLVASTATVVAPLSGAGTATITEPGAAHPFASSVPQGYASELRVRGTPASAEILALGVTGGRPYVARGANFSAFRSVTDATVEDGRRPRRAGEAIVGVDLARSLGLAVGDRLLVGGSTRPAVDHLRVVGTYRAPEPYDDQLVVPLGTARALSGKRAGRVQFVRTSGDPGEGSPGGQLATTVDVPETVQAGSTLTVTVTVVNAGEQRRNRTLRGRLDGTVRTSTVDLAPGARTTVELRFPAGEPRETTVTVGDVERTVRVVDPEALRLEGLPGTAPSGSEPLVTVTTAAGDPVANATVTVSGRTTRTDAQGRARVPLDGTGARQVVASVGDREVAGTVEVTADGPRLPVVDVSVTPPRPTPATRPTARVELSNPWNRSLATPVVVEGPRASHERTIELAPGDRQNLTVGLGRTPPGEYDVAVIADGRRLGGTTYEVTGDARLAAALATSGRRSATGIGRSLAIVLGNLQLLVATVLGLAALMTVGGTTAAFASAVQARRRTLGVHRAMGATPRQVLALVLGDAVRIGVVATAAGLALGGSALWALDAAGLLTVYGVRVLATVDPVVVAATAAGSLALAGAGATLAVLPLVRAMPDRLLSDPLAGEQGGVDRE
jgi:ABC-type lipoprotein release transport system permease subunit